MALRHARAGGMIVGFFLAVSAAARAEPPPSPLNSISDACLHGITFVDSDRGWAVGDRGVIWRTVDGGRNWEQQTSSVTCRLECVHFIDSSHGWIVGGWLHAYSDETSGVVLRTADGGETWERVPGVLPALVKVRFFNAREGLAWGASTDMYPAGIFRSHDGGRSWQTLPPGPWKEISAADFVDLQSGVIASTDGQLTAVAYGRPMSPRNPPVGVRRIRDVKIQGGQGWLVGDGGLVMHSDNGGSTWKALDNVVPGGGAKYFDFHTVSVWGNHCWVAGSPGTKIFHSDDAGLTWQRLDTGQSLPLNGLTFLDPDRGWAVGVLGTILTTLDGGQNWHPLRSGGMRTAIMGVFSEAKGAPWEMFAWYCGNEGYLGIAQFVNRRGGDLNQTNSLSDRRAEEAMVAVGGAAAQCAWNFPLRQEGLEPSAEAVFSAWDRVNDGNGLSELKETLARQIRIWRPDVIVTEDAGGSAADPIRAQIGRSVLAAIQLASDPTQLPEHKSLAGLNPWRVTKVFAKNSRGTATIRISSSQLAANLGASLDDYAMRARSLIDDRYIEAPKHWDFLLLISNLPQQNGQQDFFSGLRLAPGSEARRDVGQPPSAILEKLSRVAQQRRNMEQLISKQTIAGGAGTAWVGQLEDMTRGLPLDAASTVLFHLAMRYHHIGQSELAAETLHRLVDTCPQHDLADVALEWLVSYYASGEVSWRLRRNTQVQMGNLVRPAIAAQPALNVKALNVKVGQETLSNTAAPLYEPFARSLQSLELAELAARTRPTLFARPEFRFSVASAHKWRGQTRDAESFYTQLAASALDPAWKTCAEAEQWLKHGRGTAPKPIVDCYRTGLRPTLDGDLSDPVWQHAQAVELHSQQHDDENWPAVVKLAYDDRFLYFCAICQRATDEKYESDATPRRRDADLSNRDRIEVLLDLDRDYASYYRLAIDHRGFGSEDCCGDTTWDPRWYIARRGDDESWRVEAAIAWDELASAPPASKAAWSIGLQRIAPHTGLQSFSTPAAVKTIPQGFGLLIFQ